MPKWDVTFDVRLNSTNPEIVRLLERARALSSVIRDIPIPPGIQHQLDALNILRAVRGTTGIEGVELEEAQVKQIIESPPSKRVLPKTQNIMASETLSITSLMTAFSLEVKRPRTYAGIRVGRDGD